jgi:hypothetical protein
MSKQVSIVTAAEPPYAPGQFALVRVDHPDLDKPFVWCGRSMGWLPFLTTSTVFIKLYDSFSTAQTAAEKYVSLPLRKEYADAQ